MPDKSNADILNEMIATVNGFYGQFKYRGTRYRETALRHTFGSINNIIANNFIDNWLLPLPSSDNLRDYREEFESLELKVWSEYVVGSKDKKVGGVLGQSKYIFITWDLSDLPMWTDSLIQRVGTMLSPLAKKAASGEIIVHRLIFLDWKQMVEEENQKKLFLKIWLPYFCAGCLLKTSKYSLSFIDKESACHCFGSAQVSEHLDVALFSSDGAIADSANMEIIPVVQTSPTLGYDILQCTRRTHPDLLTAVAPRDEESRFLNLYIVEKDIRDQESISNKIINKRASDIKQFIDAFKSNHLKTLDEDVRLCSRITFQGRLDLKVDLSQLVFKQGLEELGEQERGQVDVIRNHLEKNGLVFKSLL